MAPDLKEGAADLGADGKPKDVAIDTSETSRGTQKVELDLEDAPFLEEEEEIKAEPVKLAAPVSLDAAEEKKPGLSKKKKLIILAAAAFVLLIAVGITVKVLFFKGKPAPAQQEIEHAAPAAPESENATAAEPVKPDIHVRLEPFWVEQKATQDEVRFLIVRLQLGTKDPAVAKELEMKLMPARNAIFYYLKNKDVHFLTDEENTEKLRTELLLVINQYVTDGKFDTLMFEEYVVK